MIKSFRNFEEVVGDKWKDYYDVTPNKKSSRFFNGKKDLDAKALNNLKLMRQVITDRAEEKAKEKINKLYLANLDKTIYGWIQEASIILDIKPQSVVRYLKRHEPDYLIGSKSRSPVKFFKQK